MNNKKNDEFLRKRQERQRKKRKKRVKIFLIIFLVLLLAIGAILSVTVFFPIKNIFAKGSKIYTQYQIINASGIKKGDNLIVASESDALQNLRKKLPFIESVEFERTLPDTLNIIVTDAKEYNCYQIGESYFSVSEGGWVLKTYTEKPSHIPLVICDGVECNVGEKVKFKSDDTKNLYIQITDTLKVYKLKSDNVDITNTLSLKAEIEDRFIVNFGSLKDLEPKVKHLKAMIEEIGEKETGNIDLSMWSRQNPQGAFTKTKIK